MLPKKCEYAKRFTALLAMPAFIFTLNADVLGASGSKPVEETIIAPYKVVLSPNTGRLRVRQEVEVKEEYGRRHFEFIIPGTAENLEISASGANIARSSAMPVAVQKSSNFSIRRAELERQKMELNASLLTLKARLAVWQTVPAEANGQDIAHRQTMMQAEMPGLAEEVAETERRISMLDQELGEMPVMDKPAQKIDVTLMGDVQKGQKLEAQYNYDLPNCGWDTLYNFNARPDAKTDSRVDVELLAEVWQYSGLDWNNAEIVLATHGDGPREPAPLRRWVVGNDATQPQPAPRAALKAVGKDAASVANHMAVTMEAAPAPHYTDAVYASWTLPEPGLPEGKSRLLISQNAWNAPLEWLARPSTENGNVWILAKYTLPTDQSWPAGRAMYTVDGQNIGEGYFTPKGGEAALYFGADPRVTVHTTIDANKQGETGFISTSKTWTGGWTYAIHNQHNIPIKVKVERPAPMILNDNITVTYNDNPKAVVDEKEHMLYWEVEVPANGKFDIHHSVTISSPVKLPLLPDVS